jgi:hypothetical protein
MTRTVEQIKELKSKLMDRMFPQAFAVAMGAGGGDVAAPHVLEVLETSKNILGVGYGAKVTNGSVLEQEALRVYVRAKTTRREAKVDDELVPEEIGDVPTDVIAVGDIESYFKCGESVGHFNITAGTLGCLVEKNGERYILSNNHVLADSNNASKNDEILHPGPYDGGKRPGNVVARLSEFETLDFSATAVNAMDAAIAKLDPTAVKVAEADIVTIGKINNPPKDAPLYLSVRKRGRTTQHTVGVVMDVAADIRVRYGKNVAKFEDQIAINGINGLFSQGGDSGSLIVDAVTLEPVGLLFAGGGTQTFASPIKPILARFQVKIVT